MKLSIVNGIADTTLYIVVAAVVIVLILVIIWLAVRGGRTRRLKRQFGPEYDHTVKDAGSKRKANEELEERLKRHEQLNIRPLEPPARERYQQAWTQTQTRFVDAPSEAVRQADVLVAEVMRARGYPVDNFEQRAADVSVEHPNVVQNYREAHQISQANDQNRASTEDLRRALVHYRALFTDLLQHGEDRQEQRGEQRDERHVAQEHQGEQREQREVPQEQQGRTSEVEPQQQRESFQNEPNQPRTEDRQQT